MRSKLILSLITLVLLPEMKYWDPVSSSPPTPLVVAAFDTGTLSSALDSFSARGGRNTSFDLVVCLQHSLLEDDEVAQVIGSYLANYRAQVSNCLEIRAPSAEDLSQVVYVILPTNKSLVGNTLDQISSTYQRTRETFVSMRVGKLVWMPLFLVVWPHFEDYCGSVESSERLIRASLISTSLHQSFGVDSDVYIYLGRECAPAPGSEGEEDNLFEVYTLNEKIIARRLIRERWKQETMFEGMLGRVRRRRNLAGVKIRAIASRDPSSFLSKPGDGLRNPLQIEDGTPQVVFRELQEALNFTEEHIVGDWISRDKNGTLKGKTVELFRGGNADLVISLTSLLPYRKVELSFVQPTYSNSINGFFVQPQASSFRDIVIAPFSPNLWITLFVTYLILVVSILFFAWEYGKMYMNLYQHVPPADRAFRHEVCLWAVGAVCQQGWHITPRSNSIRFAFTLGYALGLICYGAFSAAVVSILAVELVPIKSRSDLLGSSLNFYADNASSTMAYIVDYLRTHTRIRFGNRVNIKEGVARLQSKEPSCYIAFPHYFYLSAGTINISEPWVCNHLSVVPVTTSGTPSSMVVPRGSPYAELFNFIVLRMISRGLNYRYVQLYNEATTLRCSKGNQQFQPLGVNDVFTACFIVFAGFVLGVVLLCLEKLCARQYHLPRFKSKKNSVVFNN